MSTCPINLLADHQYQCRDGSIITLTTIDNPGWKSLLKGSNGLFYDSATVDGHLIDELTHRHWSEDIVAGPLTPET